MKDSNPFHHGLLPIVEKENWRNEHLSHHNDHNNSNRLLISKKLKKDADERKSVQLKQDFVHSLERCRNNFRLPRKIIFLLFVSLSIYALISSETPHRGTSPHDRNPYHGYYPTYYKAETHVKSQSIAHHPRVMDDETDYTAGIDIKKASSIALPKSFQNIADVSNFPANVNDIPFYFHIPRSGGSTIKDMMGSCLGLVGASDVGFREQYSLGSNATKLEIITSREGSRFVNVDTTSIGGIKHAKELKLVESGLADYIVTQHLYAATELFTKDHQGRYAH